MNKETRIFIWGLVLVLICGTALAIHIAEMINGTWRFNALQSFMLFFSAVGFICGGININRTI
jgi:hypothetical protein